jgi:hypothetical protein
LIPPSTGGICLSSCQSDHSLFGCNHFSSDSSLPKFNVKKEKEIINGSESGMGMDEKEIKDNKTFDGNGEGEKFVNILNVFVR